MIVDGKTIARNILTATHSRIADLGRTPVVRAIVIAPSPATESYLRIKAARAKDAGMELEVVRLADTSTTEEVIAAVAAEGADGVIVQLPLPEAIDTERVLNAVSKDKDADVLSDAARRAFETGEEGAAVPPVALALARTLSLHEVDVEGERAVVIGAGRLVGIPCATWLRRAGATVTVLTEGSADFDAALKEADIIVSGAGHPGLIKPDMIKPGAIVFDAGTSESGGQLVGDADPACADVAGLFTPVPGGVGPITVACLFANVGALLTS